MEDYRNSHPANGPSGNLSNATPTFGGATTSQAADEVENEAGIGEMAGGAATGEMTSDAAAGEMVSDTATGEMASESVANNIQALGKLRVTSRSTMTSFPKPTEKYGPSAATAATKCT
jgi:hypothetical protein